MRNVLLVIAVLSLFISLITGCATTTHEVVDESTTVVEESAGATGVDVEAVDDALVGEDLEQSMDSIDLDDW